MVEVPDTTVALVVAHKLHQAVERLGELLRHAVYMDGFAEHVLQQVGEGGLVVVQSGGGEGGFVAVCCPMPSGSTADKALMLLPACANALGGSGL